MKLLQTLLMQAKMKDALLFRQASQTEIQSTSISLVKAKRVRIPRGYISFLELTDGLVWGDFEMFSCTLHERAGTVFNQPDLLDYQQKYAEGKFFSKRLVLGRGMEFLVCYDALNKCYELINRDSLLVMLKFPRFEDLFYHLVLSF